MDNIVLLNRIQQTDYWCINKNWIHEIILQIKNSLDDNYMINNNSVRDSINNSIYGTISFTNGLFLSK